MDIRNPRTQKFLIAGILSAAVVYLYFFSAFVPFGHRAISDERRTLEAEFQSLSADLSKARQTLNNREEIERQYRILNRRWAVASELLPEEREVADLLRQVTLAGQQSGVDFMLFKPKTPTQGEIYLESPVEVKVSGGYHEVGTFLSEVANLDRIVNVTGLRIQSLDDEHYPDDTVTASFTATAYSLSAPEPAAEEEIPAPADEETTTEGGENHAG